MNDPDPLQLDAIKEECLERLEDEVRVDSQVAAIAENTASPLSFTLVSSPSSTSSVITGGVLNEFTTPLDSLVDIKDDVGNLEHLEGSRIRSQSDKAETTAPSEIITGISSRTGSSPTVSAVDFSSSQRGLSTVSSANQSSSRRVSQNRGKKHKCPICNALMAKGDLPEHIKSHETSIIPQTQRSRRHGITSALKTFPCSECSFKTNSTTELSEHLEQHEDEESGVTKPTSNACQVSPSLTVTSSPRYRILVLPKPSIVPAVVTLDDEKSNSGSPNQVFPHASSPATLLQSSRYQQQAGNSLALPVLLTSPGPCASQSAAPRSSTVSTFFPNIPSMVSQIEKQQIPSSTPPPQGVHEQHTGTFTFSTMLGTMGSRVASTLTTQRLPALKPISYSGEHPPQTEHLTSDSRGTVIHQSEIATQALANQSAQPQGCLLRQTVVSPSTQKANEMDHLHDLPSAEYRAGQSFQSLLPTVPQRQSEELRPHQPHSIDSPEEMLPDRNMSPIPTTQSHISPPRKVSVIRLSPSRETSVIHLVPIDASQTSPLNTAISQASRRSIPASPITVPPFQSSSNLTSIQTTASTSSSDKSYQPPRLSGRVEPPPNVMHLSRSSQLLSVPANQIGRSSAPQKPLPPLICTSPSQSSILSRIERLIETNANVLKSNQIVRKSQPFISIACNLRSDTVSSHNSKSLLRGTQPSSPHSTDLMANNVQSLSGSTHSAPGSCDALKSNASAVVESRSESTNYTLNNSQAINSTACTIPVSRTGSANPALSFPQTINATFDTIIESPSRCANSIPSNSPSTDSKTSIAVKSLSRSSSPILSSEDVQLIPTSSTGMEVHPPVSNPMPSLPQDSNSNHTAGSGTEVQSGSTNSIQKSLEVLTCPDFLGANILPTLSTGETPPTEAIASSSTTLDLPTTSDDRPKMSPRGSNVVIDIAASDDSDDSSVRDDIDDPCDPEPIDAPAKREDDSKNSSDDGGASDSGESTTVDPNYVPPSRERLPVKTPDSVIDAIPSFEHWIRSKFVGADSDPETPRPENDCYICARKFDSLELLKKHREERYAKLKCCKCPFKTVTERLLKGHTNKHTRPKPYTCEECGMAFTKRGKYVRHFLAHRGDYYYKCDECGAGFTEYTPYEGHVNKHRNITPYKCVKCNVAFNAKANLQDHKKRKHRRKAYTQCTLCKKHIGKHWIADHLKRHETRQEKKFLCDQCGRSFKLRLSLTRHVLKHTGERPHVCTWCGAGFKVPGALKQHERKHTGERPFKCGVCGKTFAFNTPYTYHLRTHTGERPYKCDYCGMTFAQPSPFAVHKRLHTGERPYKCKVCPEAFPSHAAVRNHMQTHANSENGSSRKKRRTRAEMENDENGKSTRPKKGRMTKAEAENEENSELTSKPKKTKRRSKAKFKDESSDSESESTEELPVGPVQPSRRSGRQTKCTKSLIEEEDESDSESTEDSKSLKKETF